ncbi:MAG: NAD(P)H-dependent glycerol-3-phosphate dehydrogenase [Candidatus Zixiibacteriota bacterium]
MKSIAVLGGGSWGIALSILLHENGHRVSIWEFNPEDAEILRTTREHKQKLPGVSLAEDIVVTSQIDTAVANAEMIFFVVPSHTVRSTAHLLTDKGLRDAIFVNCAKGIENNTCLRMSEVISSEIPDMDRQKITTLSGPSHAEEVSRRMPTSVVVAGESEEVAASVQRLLTNDYFRVYTSPDLTGVELGGSVKNIIAIAAGIVHGLGFGDNTGGALMTRGLAEIVRLGGTFGADPMTFAGLSGLGDLVTTCISKHSRNRHVGEEIGRGKTLNEVLSGMVMVAEGVKTTQSVHSLAKRLGIEMPITEQIYLILFEGKDPLVAVRELMSRDLKSET